MGVALLRQEGLERLGLLDSGEVLAEKVLHEGDPGVVARDEDGEFIESLGVQIRAGLVWIRLRIADGDVVELSFFVYCCCICHDYLYQVLQGAEVASWMLAVAIQ